MFKIKQKIIFFLNVLLSYLTIKSLNVIIKNPSIIRINLKLFGPYHINYYPNFIKNERRQINNIMIVQWMRI